jgi:hypothetical protein
VFLISTKVMPSASSSVLQDLKIGPLELTGVPFFSLAGSQKDSAAKGFDGVLTMGLFRRVFIDRTDHFAVLEWR